MAHGLILLAIVAASLAIAWFSIRLGMHRRHRAQLAADAAVAHERDSRVKAEAFASLATSIAEGADPSATLRLAVDAIPRLFGAAGCVITLPQADGRLRHVVWSGLPGSDSVMREYSFAPGEGYIGRAFAEGHAIRVDDVLHDPASHGASQDARTGTRAFVVAPLAAHGRILGCIGATRNSPFAFTDDDEETLTAVGRHVAVALAAAQSREAARLEAAQKSAILEQMGDAVLVTDIDARITLANAAASTLYGLTCPRDLIGLQPPQWQWQTLDDQGVPLILSERPLLRALRGQASNAEHCIVGVDGVERWASIASSPLRDDEGQLQGAILVAHNITERKHAEQALRTSEERFRALIAHNSDLILILEADGIFRYVSPSVESLLGYRAEELLGVRGALLIAYPEDLPSMQRLFQSMVTEGSSAAFKFRARHKDGSERILDGTATNLHDDPAIQGIVVNARDVTERERALNALVSSEKRLRLALDAAQMGTWDWTIADGSVICSDDVAGLFGRLRGSFESTIANYLELIFPDDRAMVEAAIANTLNNDVPYALEHRVRWPDGTLHWLASHARALRDADGTAIRLTGTVANVTRRKEVEHALEHQALHDGLTGLPNRVLLHDRLQQDLLRTHRAGSSMALLVMDLDRFKEVNDTLGHPAGDTLLRGVSSRLAHAVRATDTVARLGGDEFAVLLPGLDATAAARIANELRDVLKEPFELDGQAVVLETSIGIAMAPGDGMDPATLLRRADVAMYVAKRSNSGFAVYSAEQDRNDPQHLALIGELRHAVEHDQLVLHYQPKLDCRSGAVIGVEALVRWHHPTRGLLQPDQFIPLAEATDLIRPLSLWVLDAALHQAGEWHAAGRELPVAINLSMRTFQDTQLPETIAALLQRWQVPASRLQVEITESSLMVDPQRALDVLTRLSALGVRVAIDDFGTGYSSLAYLAQLPVHDLKIDRSFVRSLVTDQRSRAIVRSVIELAHSLELSVVAEGVEDLATWSMLTGFGCDQAQGFLMSQALPVAELEAWLGARESAQSSELAA